MSGDRRTLFGPYVVFCLLLSFARVAQNVPSHFGPFYLGYNYWNNRYSLGYPADWPGFWNNNNDGRSQYNRANTETTVRSCGGCSCNDQTKTATCTGPSV